MLRLLRRILRNTNNIEEGMATYESAMEFLADAGPLTSQAFAKVLESLDEFERRGYFCAVLCLCWPDGHAEYFRGEAHGTLVWPPRGKQGFGYDPVFQPDGHSRTFGEMSAEEKHGWTQGKGEPLSHRARAFAMFAEACLTGKKPA